MRLNGRGRRRLFGAAKPLFEPLDRIVPTLEFGVVDQLLVEGDGGLEAVDDEFLERAPEAHDAALAARSVDDQLGDHRIVIRRYPIAGVEAGIDADVHAAGGDVILHQARRRSEGLGVLGVDPAFDGVAAKLDLVLLAGEALAARDADLLADEVDAGDIFGYRMLDLEAGVHLDEVEFIILVEELDRAGAAIAHVGHRLGDDAAHAVALGRGDDRGRGFLQHLLVAALERAVALAEMDRLAVAVAEHLKLDVARVAEIFLQIDGVVAERRLGFGSG